MQQLRAYLTAYADFSADDWQRIEMAFESRTYPKGGFLLQAGQTDRHIWFVERGVVRVYEASEDGVEQTFYFMSSGQFTADVESFNDRLPTVGNIQAITDCQTRAVSYESRLGTVPFSASPRKRCWRKCRSAADCCTKMSKRVTGVC